MVQPARLIHRLLRQIDSQLFIDPHVHRRENDRRVGLAAAQPVQLLQRQSGNRIRHRTKRQRHQHLVRMQPRVPAAQVLRLQCWIGARTLGEMSLIS